MALFGKNSTCNRRDPKLPGHKLLSPLIQALWDEYGHYGPWCPGEVESFEVEAKGPTRPPPVLSKEAQEAQEAEYVAAAAFLEADEEWLACLRALDVAAGDYTRRPLTITIHGQPTPEPHDDVKKIQKLEAAKEEAFHRREVAGEALQWAKRESRKTR